VVVMAAADWVRAVGGWLTGGPAVVMVMSS
jgi:hypothetical protein